MAKRQKFLFYLLLLVITTTLTTCEESNFFFVKCSDCYSSSPENYGIKLQLTINSENRFVPLTFYRGPFEDGIIEFRDTARYNEQEYYLQTDTHYTIVAKYMKNARNYYVVSGARLKTNYDESSCSDACYYVTGTNADLRIKF